MIDLLSDNGEKLYHKSPVCMQGGHILFTVKSTQDYVSKVLNILQEFSYKPEMIYDINGNIEMIELLSRFGEYQLGEVLDLLRDNQMTFELFKKVFFVAIKLSKKHKKTISVNIYLSDLQSEDFIPFIYYILMQESMSEEFDPSTIAFEILENNHGRLTSEVINKLKTIQEMGFKIIVDDFIPEFCVREKDHRDNLSCDILEGLIKGKVIPNYIKIDGKFLEGEIIGLNLKDEKREKLLSLIRYLWEEHRIKFIGEWVKNGKEASILSEDGWCSFFQGRDLKSENLKCA